MIQLRVCAGEPWFTTVVIRHLSFGPDREMNETFSKIQSAVVYQQYFCRVPLRPLELRAGLFCAQQTCSYVGGLAQ